MPGCKRRRANPARQRIGAVTSSGAQRSRKTGSHAKATEPLIGKPSDLALIPVRLAPALQPHQLRWLSRTNLFSSPMSIM
jgi:hypothetical protein